jgi:pseudouridylate synthase
VVKSAENAARFPRIVRISDEVRAAFDEGRPIVALETTLIAHGFPPREGLAVGLESEGRVRAAGAVPATIGVLDGEIRVGLAESELERFDVDARKLGARDLAAAAVQGVVGATTVGGTLAVCRHVGIRFMGTGGIGGVHRGWTERPDVSADLAELVRTRALVVASGAKSILDVPATAEALETLGIPTLGFRTSTLPRFYSSEGGPPVSARIESPAEAAAVAQAHWALGGTGLLVGNPPAQNLDDVDELIAKGLEEAGRRGVAGQQVTPFVLGRLHQESGGRTLEANRRLVADNAGLAGEIAVSHATG